MNHHEVALALSKSKTANLARRRICRGLLGMDEDYQEQDIQNRTKEDNYEYFISTLGVWQSKNGAAVATFDKLVLVLKGLELKEVAGSFTYI